LKKICLAHCQTGFEIKSFLEIRSKASIEVGETARSYRKKEGPAALSSNPEFYNRLRKWREEKAELLEVEIARVLSQKTLLEIAQSLPVTGKELKEVKGMGGVRMKQFGREILEMILDYRNSNGMAVPHEARREAEKAGMDTREITFELFKSGLSVAAIAKNRHMADSTIESHLLGFVGSGRIGIEQLVESRKVKAIEECMELNHFSRIGDLKAKLGPAYSFAEIRFVLKHLETTH
jgi:ribonuclease D